MGQCLWWNIHGENIILSMYTLCLYHCVINRQWADTKSQDVDKYWHAQDIQASQVPQWYRTCRPTQEMQVWSLGWEDALWKEMATHSNILAWEIPWTEEPGGLESTESQKRWTQLSDCTADTQIYILKKQKAVGEIHKSYWFSYAWRNFPKESF